jgi:hypothetical protein
VGVLAFAPSSEAQTPTRASRFVLQRSAGLTRAEADGILFMREEEKLARDLYRVLSTNHSSRVFRNIARAESVHMAAVGRLIDRHGLSDPVAKDVPGTFQNADLQKLYDRLVASGSSSLVDALKAGVIVEKTDIADLQEHLGETTHRDVKRVYRNLLRGSRNHLRAFERLI